MKVVKKNYFNSDGNFIIRPYQLKDLGELYGVHPRTVRSWIKKLVPEVGNKKVKFFTVEEVTKIVSAIGLPKIIELKKAA